MSASSLIMLMIIGLSLLAFASPRFLNATLLRPYQIERGSGYETLLTSGFVHADVFHLVFNLITLYFFGPSLERETGTPRFVLLYISGLLISALGTCLKHRHDPGYASLGASGAILAVLFASIVYFPQQSIIVFPIPLPIPAPLFAVCYLAYTIYSARQSAAVEMQVRQRGPNPFQREPSPPPEPVARDRINHDAHFYGAITGLVFVLLSNPERFQGLLQYLGFGDSTLP